MTHRRKKALITGITGQDGSYLAELLLDKGYEVHGLVRRSSTFNTGRIDHLHAPAKRVAHLHYGDLSDASSLHAVLSLVMPDEIYHLGAQSHVRISFDIPEYTSDITGMGTLRMLEAVRNSCPGAKFYQASSSEMYGNCGQAPQREDTPFHPESPYAIAKVFAHNTARRYRDAYGMFVCCGILFNHESPRRGENFVTRKIARGVARIKLGLQDTIVLGNLSAKRDWGYAPEYCEAMWRMLQRKKADDFVIATRETHTVQDFVREAFTVAGLKNWKKFVTIDPRYYRPNEVHVLKGDASKARRLLKWTSRITFKQLVPMMVQSELRALQQK